MRFVFIGDIVGRPGRSILAKLMPRIKKQYSPDLIIANGENASGGYGMTKAAMDEVFKLGVNVITSGNHIWDKKEMEKLIDNESRIVRPVNYPKSAPGVGYTSMMINGARVVVINVQGRVLMPATDCPFQAVDHVLAQTNADGAIIVDIHAEATSEKEAFGHYFDGRVTAVIGTHTHIQTADEKILPGGTAYITDAGLTGGAGGVIGYRYREVMVRFLEGIPRRLEPEKDDPVVMGVAVDVENMKATSIERFQIRQE